MVNQPIGNHGLGIFLCGHAEILTLKLFIEGHPQTPHRGHFWPFWRYFHT